MSISCTNTLAGAECCESPRRGWTSIATGSRTRRTTAQSAALAFCLSVLAYPVSAAGLVVDPGAFSNGTDISTAVAGVTLSAPDNAPGDVGVYAYTFAGLPQFVFDPPSYRGFSQGMRLVAVFSSTVPTVSVRFNLGGAASGSGWYGELRAFDGFGGLIGSPVTTPVDFDGALMLTISDPNIKSISATFPPPSGVGFPDVAALTLIEVPEPAAWSGVLAMLALCGALVNRKVRAEDRAAQS